MAMRRSLPSLALAAAALGVTFCASLHAQTVSFGELRLDFTDQSLRPQRPAEVAFVASYTAAINAGDTTALRALVHPASLACFTTPVGLQYIDTRMKRDTAETIPDSAKVILAPFKETFASSPKTAGLTRLPVTPTAMLGIDYQIVEHDDKGTLTRQRGRTIVRPVIEQDGRMLLVEYCLTEEGERRWLALQSKSTAPGIGR